MCVYRISHITHHIIALSHGMRMPSLGRCACGVRRAASRLVDARGGGAWLAAALAELLMRKEADERCAALAELPMRKEADERRR